MHDYMCAHIHTHTKSHTQQCDAVLNLSWVKQQTRASEQSLGSINDSTLSEQKPGQPARGTALQVGCRQWRGAMDLPSRRL